jgi:ribulose-5-phosphate 4-epimerase/fuculose-1-phosphate aldolase
MLRVVFVIVLVRVLGPVCVRVSVRVLAMRVFVAVVVVRVIVRVRRAVGVRVFVRVLRLCHCHTSGPRPSARSAALLPGGAPPWAGRARDGVQSFGRMTTLETAKASGPLRDRVSAAEWEQRVALAACYRLVAHFGWDDIIFTHLSARVPGPEHHFLINPYGMLFEEITASSLVKIDLAGAPVERSAYPVNPAGFTIHSAIHAAREDAIAVLHVHCIDGVAVSAQAGGVLPISQQSIFVLSSLGYHNYEGVALNDEEKPRLVADLGRNTFLMLRNHGLLAVGTTIPDALLSLYTFATACTIQVRAQSGGGDLVAVDQRIISGAGAAAKAATKGAGGALAWPGLLRMLDRRNPGYAQ